VRVGGGVILVGHALPEARLREEPTGRIPGVDDPLTAGRDEPLRQHSTRKVVRRVDVGGAATGNVLHCRAVDIERDSDGFPTSQPQARAVAILVVAVALVVRVRAAARAGELVLGDAAGVGGVGTQGGHREIQPAEPGVLVAVSSS
jgi:hypothetical protein